MNVLEIIGTALGLIYLCLEYRVSAWLWVVSLVMPAVYAVVYWQAGLYADFAINVYYIFASLYGLAVWMLPHKCDRPRVHISHTPRRVILPVMMVCIGLFGLIGYVLVRFTDSTVPWPDAATTALSIVAMWMLSRKYVEQWLVWMVVDVACAALYVYKDLPFTAGLYALYAVVAVAGYRKWKREIA